MVWDELGLLSREPFSFPEHFDTPDQRKPVRGAHMRREGRSEAKRRRRSDLFPLVIRDLGREVAPCRERLSDCRVLAYLSPPQGGRYASNGLALAIGRERALVGSPGQQGALEERALSRNCIVSRGESCAAGRASCLAGARSIPPARRSNRVPSARSRHRARRQRAGSTFTTSRLLTSREVFACRTVRAAPVPPFAVSPGSGARSAEAG